MDKKCILHNKKKCYLIDTHKNLFFSFLLLSSKIHRKKKHWLLNKLIAYIDNKIKI